MVKYKLIENRNGIKRYEYYPEGNVSASGIFEIDSSGVPKLIEESTEDVMRIYAAHAWNDVRKTKKDSGTVAWY